MFIVCVCFWVWCPLSLFSPAIGGKPRDRESSQKASSKLKSINFGVKTKKSNDKWFQDHQVYQDQKIRAPDVPTRWGRGAAAAAPPIQDLSGVQGQKVHQDWWSRGAGGTGGRPSPPFPSQVQEFNLNFQKFNKMNSINCKQVDFNKLDYVKGNCPRATSQGVPGRCQVPSQQAVLFTKEELEWGRVPPTPSQWLRQSIQLTMAMAANCRTGCPETVAMAAQQQHVAMAAHKQHVALTAQKENSGIPEKSKEDKSFNGMHNSAEPYFLSLRKCLPWWEKHAPLSTLKLIQEGVKSSFPLPEFLDSKPQFKTAKEEAQALEVLSEYMEVGAVVKNPPGPTRHLVPWFVISK